MTVRELIDKLQTMPQDLPVAMYNHDADEWAIVENIHVREGWQTSPDGVIIERDKFGRVGTTDVEFVGLIW